MTKGPFHVLPTALTLAALCPGNDSVSEATFSFALQGDLTR